MPLILIPYVSRTIGLERYGISEFSLELAAFFGTIILYGFDFTMSKNLSRSRHDSSYFSKLFWNVFYSRIAIGIIIIPFFWITGIYFVDDLFTKTILLYSFLFFISRLFSSWWFFQGIENIKWIAIGNFLTKALILFLVVLLVKKEKDYPLVVFAFGLSQLFVNVLAWTWIIFRYQIQFFIFKLSEIINLLKNSFFTFFNELLIIMFTSVNIMIVKNYLSAEDLGLYAATMKVVMITQNLVIQSVSKSLYPNLALAFNQNLQEYKDRLDIFRNLLVIILITLAFVIIFGREIIVQLLFGSGFSGVTSLLTYVSFLPLFIGLTNMYGWQGLYIMNRERTMSYISLFVGILSISCLLMLIERFGLKGVLIIRNISEVIIFSLAYFFFQKFYKSEQNKSKGVT